MTISMRNIIISLIVCCILSIIIYFLLYSVNSPEKKTVDYYSETVSSKNILQNVKLYKVINIFKRENPTVYTQGLFYHDHAIYESGGLYRKSTLTKMEWPSQKKLQEIKLESKYFAEGISGCKTNNILYQLTYKERDILLYNFPDLKFLGSFKMPHDLIEGWGMSSGFNNDEFFATDGSDKIYTLKLNKTNNELYVKSSITVAMNYKSISYLNELTYDGSYIFCNIYFDSHILKINPYNGVVLNSYDMKPLIDYELENGALTRQKLSNGDVLNGIVYIPERKTYIVTGKLWDYYYEVVFN